LSADERLRKAAEAGKRASASPYERQAKTSGFTRLFLLAENTAIAFAAVRTEGLLSAALWLLFTANLTLNLAFWPLANKIRRRRMLLAREQVHQVRQLDASNPVALGLGHLFDADPGLDRLSAEAGVRFALARVGAVLDEVEKSTPKPSLWGFVINDDGTSTKVRK
jgi:hypothetical protein